MKKSLLILVIALSVAVGSSIVSPLWAQVPYTDFASTRAYYYGARIPVGTVIEAYDPDGVLCGQFTVHTTGEYGWLHVYGDQFDTAEDEGAVDGDSIAFKINDENADAIGNVVWKSGQPGGWYQVDLYVGGFPPIIEGFPTAISFEEDQTFQIDLDTLVFDENNLFSELSWTVENESGISIMWEVDSITQVGTFSAEPDSHGVASIKLRVTDPTGFADSIVVAVTVFAVDDAPLALDDTVSTNEDTSVTIYVLANDTDADGDTLRIDSVTQGSGGVTIIVDGATSLTYSPELNFFGADSFTYIVSDGQGYFDTASVTVTVNPINDPPVFSSILPDTGFAEDDTLYIPFTRWFDYVADPDDPDTTLGWNFSGNSQISFLVEALGVTFTSVQDWFGAETLAVVVNDSEFSEMTSITLAVISVSDPPTITSPDSAIAIEDVYFRYVATATDPDGPALSWVFDQRPSWLSAANDTAFGTPVEGTVDTSFRVIASDGILTDTLMVTLNVIAVNDPPVVAVNTGLTVSEGDSILLTSSHLQVTDADNPPASLIFAFETQPSMLHGEFKLNGVLLPMDSSFTQEDIDSGRVSFMHDGSETTLDSIGFFISDGAGETVHIPYFPITILPVNDSPEPFALLVPVDGDTAVIVNGSLVFIWESANDVDSDSLVYIFHLLGPDLDTSIAGFPETSVTLTGVDGLTIDSLYTWFVEVTDGEATTASSATFGFYVPPVLALDPLELLPMAYALHQNYPNPFNPSTTIQFDLPIAVAVYLVVYDLIGREVASLAEGRLEAGYHSLIWNGRDARGREVPTGMYIVLMVTPEFRKSIKVVLLK